MTIRSWLVTPMQVSYAQVLGAGVVTVVLVWMAATLALWLYELGRQVKVLRSIESHLLGRLDSLGNELHLCKRTLGRRPLPRPPRLD
jgi:hypothetical protein